MKFGSLFSGIGGMDLGLERAGMECVWQVEIDGFCRKVLTKHWPDVPKYNDVREVGKHNLERVDLIAGGFPCQDISNAGKRAGITGEQSGLWSEFFRIVCELRPQFVLVENVAALLHRGIERVLGDLAEGGYDAMWRVLRACDFGLPHLRERVFIVAYRDSFSFGAEWFGGLPESPLLAWQGLVHPGRIRSADGIPGGLDRIQGVGNAVVPQVAQWIGERIIANGFST